MTHRTSQAIRPIDASKLWVISVVSNPRRYRVRYHLFREFDAHVRASGANHLTVEMAFGSRPFEVTEAGNPLHVQLRSFHELWHKENMINIGVQRIPDPNFEYVAWVDADVAFERKDWVQETVQMLQHHDFVQMYSTAIDIGPSPSFDPVGINVGFAYCYHHQHLPEIPQLLVDKKLNHERHTLGGGCLPYAHRTDAKTFWHPGYAWAARREALEHTGGLLDTGVLGAGDHHMSLALIAQAHQAMPPGVTAGYRKAVMDWQWRCEKYVRRDIGYVPGTITHGWHGKKADRKYWSRWRILVDNLFDPSVDLKRDAQGLWQLEDRGDDRSLRLRDQIRKYFLERNEDSIDME